MTLKWAKQQPTFVIVYLRVVRHAIDPSASTSIRPSIHHSGHPFFTNHSIILIMGEQKPPKSRQRGSIRESDLGEFQRKSKTAIKSDRIKQDGLHDRRKQTNDRIRLPDGSVVIIVVVVVASSSSRPYAVIFTPILSMAT